MAVRVRDFSRAHPSADANYAPVLARLEERVTRMEALAKQQQGGYLATRSSAARRRGLRRRLHHELLRHLVTVAEVAASEEPALAEKFRLPPGNGSHEAFRTLARKMLEQGQAERELLAKHGWPTGCWRTWWPPSTSSMRRWRRPTRAAAATWARGPSWTR